MKNIAQFNELKVRIRGYEGIIVRLEERKVCFLTGIPVVLYYDVVLKVTAREEVTIAEVEPQEIEFLLDED